MNNTQKMNIETIALLCDTIPDGTGGKDIMDKILKNIHPYKVYYTPSRDSWQTSIYVDGIRQKVSRKSYKELVKYLVEFYKAQEKKTFADIYSAFMEEASLWKADNTILEYIKSYRRYYENSDIIHIPLQDLDTVTLKTWIIKTVVAEKMTRKKYIKFISPLSGLLQYALEHDYITQNPLQTINTKQLPFVPAKPKRSSEKAFSREEATAISNVAKQEYQRKPSHTALAIAFLFETGIRLGECAALKWSDIEGNTLMVSRMERKCPIPNDDFTSYSNWRYEIIDTTVMK